MKKILHYNPVYFPWIGGIETYIETIIDNIDCYDFEVITNALPNQSTLQRIKENATVRRFRPVDLRAIEFPIEASRKARALAIAISDILRINGKRNFLRRANFDLLHVHSVDIWDIMRLDGLLKTRLATQLARRLADFSFVKQPTLFTDHSIFCKASGPIVDMQMATFENIICVEKQSYENVIRYTKENKLTKNVWFIPNSVDTGKFSYQEPPHKERLIIGYAARLGREGEELILQFIKEMPSYAELNIAGAGNAEEVTRYRKIFDNKWVHFYPNISQEKMPEFNHNIDVFLNPTPGEGIGRASIEAMACGRPVVMLSGSRYPLINGKTGYLIKSINELNPLLKHLKEDRAELATVGKNAREVVDMEFSNKVVIPRIKEVYRRLTAT